MRFLLFLCKYVETFYNIKNFVNFGAERII